MSEKLVKLGWNPQSGTLYCDRFLMSSKTIEEGWTQCLLAKCGGIFDSHEMLQICQVRWCILRVWQLTLHGMTWWMANGILLIIDYWFIMSGVLKSVSHFSLNWIRIKMIKIFPFHTFHTNMSLHWNHSTSVAQFLQFHEKLLMCVQLDLRARGSTPGSKKLRNVAQSLGHEFEQDVRWGRPVRADPP